MNVVQFGQIRICNYKSIGEEVIFDYRDYGGMTYIKGENLDMPDLANGTGKSTIFVDALLMVLFGIQSNKFKNSNVFHRQAKHDLGWIKLQMFVNEQEWNVQCVFNRSKKGDVGLTRSLYEGTECDENSRTKSSMAQTLKFISEEVLKCDADTFKNAVVLSTSNIANFFTLPRPAKDAYLDSVFTLAAFGAVYKEVKKQLNSLKKELASQREIFEGLKENHEQILQKSKEHIAEKEKELAELDKKIKSMALEIKKLKENVVDIDDLESAITVKKAEIADYAKQIQDLEAERAEFSINEANVSELVDQYSNELHNEAEEKKSEINKKIKEIEDKKKQLEDVIPKLEERLAEIEKQEAVAVETIEELSKLASELHAKRMVVCGDIKSMMAVKKEFESTIDLLCEECKKKTHDHFNFDQEKYEALEEENSMLNSECNDITDKQMKPFEEEVKCAKVARTETNEKITKAENAINSLQIKVAELETAKDSITSDISTQVAAKERDLYEEARKEYEAATKENLSKSADIAKLIDAAKDEVRRVESQISETKSSLKRIEDGTKILKDLLSDKEKVGQKENPFDSLVIDGEKKIKTAKQTIQAILKDQRKFDLLANIFCEDGVKKYIVSNIVASLNVIIKKYLAEMGADFVVVFDDKFQYNFYTPSGEAAYFDFSSGERRRLDMAVMLALRDILFTNGLVTNILVVDEVLDSGIDQYALFAIINILRNKTQDRDLGCIIISHRSELFTDMGEDTFDRIQYVIKENGQSSLRGQSAAAQLP